MARLCPCLFNPHRCVLFSHLSDVSLSLSQPAFGFLRGNSSMCSFRLNVLVGGGDITTFLHHRLEPEVPLGFCIFDTFVFRNKLCFKVGDSPYFLSSF